MLDAKMRSIGDNGVISDKKIQKSCVENILLFIFIVHCCVFCSKSTGNAGFTVMRGAGVSYSVTFWVQNMN